MHHDFTVTGWTSFYGKSFMYIISWWYFIRKYFNRINHLVHPLEFQGVLDGWALGQLDYAASCGHWVRHDSFFQRLLLSSTLTPNMRLAWEVGLPTARNAVSDDVFGFQGPVCIGTWYPCYLDPFTIGVSKKGHVVASEFSTLVRHGVVSFVDWLMCLQLAFLPWAKPVASHPGRVKNWEMYVVCRIFLAL